MNNVLYIGSVFEPFLYNGLRAVLQSKGNFERFIKRLHSFGVGKVKTTAPNLPDKLYRHSGLK